MVFPGTNKISHAIEGAHTGGVFSLCVMKNGDLLSGGGKDRQIKKWEFRDSEYKATAVQTEVHCIPYDHVHVKHYYDNNFHI